MNEKDENRISLSTRLSKLLENLFEYETRVKFDFQYVAIDVGFILLMSSEK